MKELLKDRFVLISRWHLDCTIEAAWQHISQVREWPKWWPNVRAVLTVGVDQDAARADGLCVPRVGSQAWIDWRTRLGYGLRMHVTTTRVAAPFELEGVADGDLDGVGLWVLESQGDKGVVITYRWDVHLNRAWMRLTAPVLRPLFAWNHFAVMREGAKAMARDIGCRLLRYQDHRFSPGTTVDDLRALRWPEPSA
jgi:hypothetical protein